MTYLISQEIAHNDDRHDEDNDVEDLEVEVHWLVQTPAYDDYERGVEQGCLYGCAHAVCKGEIHLVVPCFVDCWMAALLVCCIVIET